MATSFPVSISTGTATVEFSDGTSFSFATEIPADAIEDSEQNWHDYNVNRAVPTVLRESPSTIFSLGHVLSVIKFELEDVWMGLRDYPALEYMDDEKTFSSEFGNPVSTGDETVVDLFGAVTHIVDNDKRVLVNLTTPTHDLHNGYVIRHPYSDGSGRVFVQSIGFGTGAMATLNELGANVTWGGNSLNTISLMASEYYAIRTGKHSIYYPTDPEFSEIPIVPRGMGNPYKPANRLIGNASAF